MRVFVTGAAGFIGSAVVEELASRGHAVLGLDSLNETLYDASSRRDRIEQLSHLEGVDVVVDDLRSCDLDGLLGDVDAVVHQAAVPGLIPSWSSFDEYNSNNVLGTYRLLTAMNQAQITAAVMASTSSVYGAVATASEDGPFIPNSPYGVTKLAAENLWWALLYGQPMRSATALRYFSVYGPRQRPDMAIGRFLAAIDQGDPVTITGDGTQTRTYTFIGDISRVTVDALESTCWGPYNVAGTEQVSVVDLVNMMGRIVGREPVIEWREPRRGDQLDVKGNTQRARTELGFHAHVTLEQGLSLQYEAYTAAKVSLADKPGPAA